MSTRSIFREFKVKDSASAERLVAALEKAENNANRAKRSSASYTELKGKDLKEVFRNLK